MTDKFRFDEGEARQEWIDLLTLGGTVRSLDATWERAQALGAETMTRVRENVRRLIELLPQAGYELTAPEPWVPPEDDVRQQLDALEAVTGPLPLALRCWYEHLGRVDLSGSHPDWPFRYADPLVVDAQRGTGGRHSARVAR